MILGWDELFSSNNSVVITSHPVNRIHTEHSHDFFEIGYVKSGVCYHVINSIKTVLKAGDYYIIDIGCTHGLEPYKDAQATVYNCTFKPSLIDQSLKNCTSFGEILSNYLITFNFCDSFKKMVFSFKDKNNEIFDLFQKILDESEKKEDGYIQVIRAFLIEIIIKSMRKYKEENSRTIYQTNKINPEEILSYINSNYNKDISLSDIAKNYNISNSYLSRIFPRLFGITFINYLQDVRIKNACRLLANTDKKIPEIAELVGYNDIKFFNEIFKKHTNLSPIHYKKKFIYNIY